MTIIFYILCIVTGVFITYVLGMQFYKLGLNLKDKFPIIYRLYTIFWGFVGALVLIGMLAGIKSCIDDYQKEKRKETLGAIIAPSENQYQDMLRRINLAKKEKFTDKEIFQGMLESNRYKKEFNLAKNAGFTHKEIAQYFGLYLGYDYVEPTDK